tara:strand:- start:29 stop:403 length:375 start_codon:yes stop_codon:yes gene_type:complete
MIKYLRIDHIALHVSDIQRSKNFYEEYFGFETYFEHETPTGMPISYLKLGETVLELTGFSDPPASGFHFCLEVDRFDDAVNSLTKSGVKVLQKPHKTAARHPREESWQRVVFEGPDSEQIEIRG